MKDHYYENLLNIHTSGYQKGFNESAHFHRYEPTPYFALEELFKHYQLTSSDRVVDFGCGKGRLNFFIHYLYKAAVVGVEMNEDFYQEALENRRSYVKKTKNMSGRIHFLCCFAEEYPVGPQDNVFYFFNPFSVPIFIKVINNILQSAEEHPRKVDVVLYYASEDYLFFLENQTAFEIVEEVRLPNVYEHNPNERFLVYRLD